MIISKRTPKFSEPVTSNNDILKEILSLRVAQEEILTLCKTHAEQFGELNATLVLLVTQHNDLRKKNIILCNEIVFLKDSSYS